MMTKNMHSQSKPSPDADLTCQQVTALLVDFIAGDMAAPMRMAFDVHLRHCQACTAFLATYRETIDATRSMRDEAPSELRLARVWHLLRRRIEGTP